MVKKPIISVIAENNELSDSMYLPVIRNGWYLHGKLEDMIGYDIAVCYELSDECPVEKFEVSGRQVMALKLDGIYPVKVYGIDKECTGYFWMQDTYYNGVKSWLQRGLVVLNSDKEGIEYAIEKYNNKSEIL